MDFRSLFWITRGHQVFIFALIFSDIVTFLWHLYCTCDLDCCKIAVLWISLMMMMMMYWWWWCWRWSLINFMIWLHVSVMSTGDSYSHYKGRKWQVLCNSRTRYQHCWHCCRMMCHCQELKLFKFAQEMWSVHRVLVFVICFSYQLLLLSSVLVIISFLDLCFFLFRYCL